ncbi:similar to crustacean cardioactive peptide precursor [Tribolium castaneum]|uniref:CCAP preprohormone n=1 Tax=Tribolium castaneum TaxID=7070 RepID=I6LLP8_TRICA|nr:similar to crustacean cardioactive peptide precursor [Tribolium castaneum]ADM26614.1 CCAP preprohormone [Tribolium castaneum]|eukprot:NP_001280497.1 similar to crustacean cardioactive peptide precursor [Tribolium castaneum]
MKNMTTAKLFVICIFAALAIETHSRFLPKSISKNLGATERVLEPKKRPFCNAFTGCGRKRSNLPALPEQSEVVDENLGSLLELSAEPAVEDLSRQIMSEAKLWEAIQEANMELHRRRQESAESSEEDAAVPARSATASCALPPCYI